MIWQQSIIMQQGLARASYVRVRTYMNYRTYVRVTRICVHPRGGDIATCKQTNVTLSLSTERTRNDVQNLLRHTPKIFVIRQIPRSITQ